MCLLILCVHLVDGFEVELYNVGSRRKYEPSYKAVDADTYHSVGCEFYPRPQSFYFHCVSFHCYFSK